MKSPHEWPNPPDNQNPLHAHMIKVFDACMEISKAKNADYASDIDPFANFRQVEHLGVCSVATGIVVRLSDKFSRLANLVCSGRQAAVKDESVRDTIRDAINYLAILDAWLAKQDERWDISVSADGVQTAYIDCGGHIVDKSAE